MADFFRKLLGEADEQTSTKPKLPFDLTDDDVAAMKEYNLDPTDSTQVQSYFRIYKEDSKFLSGNVVVPGKAEAGLTRSEIDNIKVRELLRVASNGSGSNSGAEGGSRMG